MTDQTEMQATIAGMLLAIDKIEWAGRRAPRAKPDPPLNCIAATPVRRA